MPLAHRREQRLSLIIALAWLLMPICGLEDRCRSRGNPAFVVNSRGLCSGMRRFVLARGDPCARSAWTSQGARDRPRRGWANRVGRFFRRGGRGRRSGSLGMAIGKPPVSVAAGLQVRDGGKYRLMLVDDEEALRRAVSDYLEQRGYGVESHASAQEALDSLRGHTAAAGPYPGPDLIVTDVNMPVMNGFEFLEALRSGGGRESGIPVIFLTARGMTSDRIEGYRAGVNAYLAKPFDPEELVSIVDNVIFNHVKAAELAAVEAAAIEAAEYVPVERKGDETAGVMDGGGNSEVLEDVRRELGDIKALLLADRAQRRETLGGGASSPGDGETATRGPRLLTSSKDDSLDRAQRPPLRRPLGEAVPGAGGAGGSLGDAIGMPPVFLSDRERSVLALVLKGYTNREISRSVDLSVRMVEKYVSNMLAKTGTSNRTELVRFSLRENLVAEDDLRDELA